MSQIVTQSVISGKLGRLKQPSDKHQLIDHADASDSAFSQESFFHGEPLVTLNTVCKSSETCIHQSNKKVLKFKFTEISTVVTYNFTTQC